jgi:hypothetical protein
LIVVALFDVIVLELLIVLLLVFVVVLCYLQNPDPKTKFKMEGGIGPDGKYKKPDSNTEWFKRLFGNGRGFQIEIDAMQARREQFRTHILRLIDDHFDTSIWEREVKNATETARDEVRELLKEEVSELDDDWVH